jgi:hypothetical protein
MDEKHNATLKAKAKKGTAASAAAKESSKKHPASGILVNCKFQRRLGPASFANTARQRAGPTSLTIPKCRRYDGNGNPISSFPGKPANAKNLAKKGGGQQTAYLTAAVESLVKKGLKKAMKGKKRKRNNADDSSSDSDSE